MAKPLRIGLTGGIGSGKSTVAALFEKRGVPVIDADAAAHRETVPHSPGLAEIVKAFGRGILMPDGSLDRTCLRQHVFADPESRRRLEAILHPRIRAAMDAQVNAETAPYVVLAIPLLLETGWERYMDRVLVIDLPQAEQIRRVRIRDGHSPELIEQILKTQYPRDKRLAAADDVITNCGPPEALDAQVETLHRFYLERTRH